MSNTMFRKTYKRETAVGCVLWLLSMIMLTAFVKINPETIELLKMTIIPVFTLAGAMFGTQVYQQSAAARMEGDRDRHPFRPDPEEFGARATPHHEEVAHAVDTQSNS